MSEPRPACCKNTMRISVFFFFFRVDGNSQTLLWRWAASCTASEMASSKSRPTTVTGRRGGGTLSRGSTRTRRVIGVAPSEHIFLASPHPNPQSIQNAADRSGEIFAGGGVSNQCIKLYKYPLLGLWIKIFVEQCYFIIFCSNN